MTDRAKLAEEAKRHADEYANLWAAPGGNAGARASNAKDALHAAIDALSAPDVAPQPTPDASQDGGGAARLTDARLQELFDGLDFSCMCTADDLFYLIARAVEDELRSPLPGRESTAQAGAGEDESYTADELSPAEGWTDARIAAMLDKCILKMLPPDDAKDNMQYRITIRAMRRAQKRLAAEAAAPDAAMREALQRAAHLCETHKLLSVPIGPLFGVGWDSAVKSCASMLRAEASTLPEPRAGEAEEWQQWFNAAATASARGCGWRTKVCGYCVRYNDGKCLHAAQGEAPAVATQEGRKPLSLDKIHEMRRAAVHGPADWVEHFARAIERAHGIDPGAMGQSGGAA